MGRDLGKKRKPDTLRFCACIGDCGAYLSLLHMGKAELALLNELFELR